MPLFGGTSDFKPIQPAPIVGLTKGKHWKLLAEVDPYLSDYLEEGERVDLYSICFVSVSDELVVVTDRQVIVAKNHRKVGQRRMSTIRETSIGVKPNGTWVVSLTPYDSNVSLMQFLVEGTAQQVCHAIDRGVTS
jgi:hypothetical protein